MMSAYLHGDLVEEKKALSTKQRCELSLDFHEFHR